MEENDRKEVETTNDTEGGTVVEKPQTTAQGDGDPGTTEPPAEDEKTGAPV